MADSSSKSPREKRSSTNDPEKYSKGEVKLPTTSKDPINQHAWEIFEEPDYKPKY